MGWGAAQGMLYFWKGWGCSEFKFLAKSFMVELLLNKTKFLTNRVNCLVHVGLNNILHSANYMTTYL